MEYTQNEEQGGRLVSPENELQLLETTVDFKAKKACEGANSECVKDKYAQILSIFILNLSQEGSRKYFQHNEGSLRERSDSSQNQTASLQIYKSFRLGDTKWSQ